MGSEGQTPEGFEAIHDRLQRIAEAVGDENVSLDEALDLFEEAVSLGMRVSDFLEEDIPADVLAGADPMSDQGLVAD